MFFQAQLKWPTFLGMTTRFLAKSKVKNKQAVAQTNHLPFDRLRASGDMLKSCNFSGHAELVEA
jgi:hypothetical protein